MNWRNRIEKQPAKIDQSITLEPDFKKFESRNNRKERRKPGFIKKNINNIVLR